MVDFYTYDHRGWHKITRLNDADAALLCNKNPRKSFAALKGGNIVFASASAAARLRLTSGRMV